MMIWHHGGDDVVLYLVDIQLGHTLGRLCTLVQKLEVGDNDAVLGMMKMIKRGNDDQHTLKFESHKFNYQLIMMTLLKGGRQANS